jgi:hypothetical protein
MGVSSDAAACAGVFSYQVIKLIQQQILAESGDLISRAHALIRQQVRDLAASWNWYDDCWNQLANTHASLHVYLDKFFYKAEKARHETCLNNLSCLVCSTSFLHKLLGHESCWSKTIVQNYELFQLLLDETHRKAQLKQAGLVAHFP